jgi:hypothetical protein
MDQLGKINHKVHLAITWSAVPLMIFFFIGMVPMSGFIPPPSPMASAAEIVAMYSANLTGIRLGMVVSALAFTLMFAWGCSIAVWTYRIEKGFPILTFTQLVTCSAGSALTFLIFLIWSVASFRPDVYAPETVLMLNDLGWFCFLWIVPPFSLWSLAMGLAILQDKRPNPIYPRWTAFVCFWEALLMESTMLIALFKTGPFAFDGILGFWVPVIAFFIWMVVMTIYTHKAIMRHVREEESAI